MLILGTQRLQRIININNLLFFINKVWGYGWGWRYIIIIPLILYIGLGVGFRILIKGFTTG